MGLAVAANNLAVNAVGVVALRASLHTADPGTTGASEIAGGSPAYARQVVAWNPAATSSASLVADAVFDIPAGTTPTHAGFWTTAGVWLGGAPLTPPPGTYVVQGTFTLDAASILAVAEVLPTAYDLAILSHPDLVAYLPLGGEYSDWSNNGHDATVHGTPGEAVFALDGSAATVFNGVDEWLELANHPDLSIDATGELYIEYWLQPDVQDFTDAEGTGPYIYHMSKLSHTALGDDPNQDEYAGRLYNWTTYRPSRLSGYAFNNAGGLGAGSYSQPAAGIPLDEPTYYGIAFNTNDTSVHAGGYTRHYRGGRSEDVDGLTNPYGIVPTAGTAPLRLARGPASFFAGRLAKVAIYRAVPEPDEVLARFRLLVPPVTGTIDLHRDLGTVSKTATGRKVTLPVGSAGVPAGATNIVTVAHAYTAGTPTVGDSQGNTYALVRTSTDTGLTMRESEYAAPIHAALEDGDAVQATLTADVDRRLMGAEAWTGIAFDLPLVDKHNSGQGTSTTPGTSTFTGTTSQPDELVRAGLLVAGPNTDGFTGDTVGEFADLAAVGTNTGSNDLTLRRAWKAVAEAGSFRFLPTLGTSRNWLTIVSAYPAGDAVPVPPTVGTGRWLGLVGDNDETASGTTLVLTSTADTIPVGHSIGVWVHEDWTSAGPTVTDSRGNVYTRHKTIPSTGNTSRMALFLAPVTTAVQPGDTITITFPSAVTRRVATAHEFSGVLTPVVLNQSNNNSNTGVAPSTTMPATTHADCLLLGFVCVEGPLEQAADFEPDVGNQWTHLPAVGTTGAGTASDDRTIYPCFRIVAATGAYQLNPALGTSAKYIVGATAFNAG